MRGEFGRPNAPIACSRSMVTPATQSPTTCGMLGVMRSEKQQQVFEFIGVYIGEHRRPPTNREIGVAVNIASTGHVDYHLSALVKRGLIVRDANTARGVRLTTEGETLLREGLGPDENGVHQFPVHLARQTVRVPIHGRIAAGAPIEAISDPADVIEVGADIADDACFALRVRGTSMIEDLIADGDVVIIRPSETANNGDTVVALINGSERGDATLKRFYREGNMIRLQPANQAMEPLYVPATDVRVQGKVIALIRRI